MNEKTLKYRGPTLIAAMALLIGAGCSDGTPSAPDALMAPQFSEAADSTGYALVEGGPPEDLDAQSVSKVIGDEGGELKVAGHRLSVPKKAVSEPTTFTMTVLEDGYVAVDLTATRTDAEGNTIDVGARGFAEPLNLKMTYEWATNVDDPSTLEVVWLEDESYEGDKVAQPGTVNESNQWVIVKLDHFSKYCMASNRDDHDDDDEDG